MNFRNQKNLKRSTYGYKDAPLRSNEILPLNSDIICSSFAGLSLQGRNIQLFGIGSNLHYNIVGNIQLFGICNIIM
jgi:hypothetical protein